MKIKLILFLSLVLFYQSSQAISLTVKKLKGRQALVETSIPLEEGQTYELQTDTISIDTLNTKNQIRKNTFQAGVQIQSLSGATVQDNEIFMSARYGWNFEIFEVGPTLIYQSVDLGAGTDSTILAGGYFDYNIAKNKYPKIFIWGPTLSAEFGSKQFNAGGSASLINFDGGAFVTWFLAQSQTALRVEAKYHSQKISTSASDTTLSGFKSDVYLAFYF